MKRLLSFLVVVTFTFSGCSTISKFNNLLTTVSTTTTSTQTTSEIIVDAEKTTAIAAESFTEFLRLDRRYTDIIKVHVPKVHDAANYLRAPVGNPPLPRDVYLLKKVREATKAFKSNRTPDGEANLRTAVATIKGLLFDTKTNITQIQSITQ